MIQFDASLYWLAYLYSMLAITLMYSLSLFNKDSELVHENTNNPLILIYVLVFAVLVGWRPPSGLYFGDSSNYARSFENFVLGINVYNPNSGEWIFSWLQSVFAKFSNRADFFLFIECVYIFPVFWACRKLIPNHACLMFMFCMGAFSFFTYGTNGMRNGMACSMIIGALVLVNGNTTEKIIAAAIAYAAFNIHRTTGLPILCTIVAYLCPNTKLILKFWVASIFISFVAGGSVESFFTGLGFDERMDQYSSANNIHAGMFSSRGFRWDFLLYSSMPVLLGYYVVVKREIWDKNYLLILNCYILCNAFWVMMIRASYSNRFAYLSWFLYALVLSYPLLKFELWDDQGKKVAQIFMLHFFFTYYMYI